MSQPNTPPGPVPTVNLADLDAAHNAWEADGRPTVTADDDPDPSEA